MIQLGIFLGSYTISGATNSKIDSLQLQLTQHRAHDRTRVDLLNAIGYEYWIVDADQSIWYGIEAMQLATQLVYTGGMAKAHRIIGVAYWAQGHQNSALKYLHESRRLYEQLQDDRGVANTILNTGMIYADLDDITKALAFYEQAINRFTALGLKGRIATTYTKMGTIFIEQKDYQKALQYLTHALQMHTENDFTYGIAEVHNRLGILYLAQQEIEQAHYHIQKSMVLGHQINDVDGLTHNHIIYARILLHSQKLIAAEEELGKGLQIAKENKLKKYELAAYETFKKLKQQQNELKTAISYYDSYTVLKDSLFNTAKSKQIAYLELSNKLARKDQELVLLRTKKKKDNLIKLLLSIGVLLIIIAGYVIYTIARQRAKKSKQLAIKNQELLAFEHALIQKELENSELKRVELKQQVDFQNKELTAYTLNFIQKNEVIQQLHKTISAIKRSTKVDKEKLIADLHKIIRKNLSIDRDWEDFNRFFEDAHQGFYSLLKSKHHELSSNDLKICSLIRLNLNSKEMASILGISPESVKKARYRLRKKLTLSPKEEIFSYLVALEQL